MTSVRQLLATATRVDDADSRSDAEILLAHVLGRSRSWLFAHAEFEPDATAQAEIERLFAARARGEPIAYLLGRRGFHALELQVNPHVLIPREDTELLVEAALARMPLDTAVDVADLGTGSGAIALAIAHARPRARLLATDDSADALVVATANTQRLQIGNVDFASGSWCGPLAGLEFDLIVSNPPYIAADDEHLAQGDLRFEPITALVSGADGLEAIREIVTCAPEHLRSGGWLLLEHGWDQGEAVRGLLLQRGLTEVATLRDFGGQERVSLGQWGPLPG